MTAEFFLEPIRFFNNAGLLGGKNSEILPRDVELITDLDLAMTLENDMLNIQVMTPRAHIEKTKTDGPCK